MANTMYIKRGSTFVPTTDANLDIHDTLPPGTYLVKQMPMGGPLYFDQTSPFVVPKKLYGDTQKHTTRILKTFNERTGNTGVLLSGEKGSGKTLLAKHMAITSDLVIILINDPWVGDAFSDLISGLAQHAVVIFDEFEKVYFEEQAQEGLLTLLDGVFATKKLFILTCNDQFRVNDHLKNRPGRIFYFIKFKGLSPEFVREYCEDKLENKDNINSVCNLSMLFAEFNFDMLAAVVEEMNRFNENAGDAISILNAQPDSLSSYGQFVVTVQSPGGAVMNVFSPVNGVLDRSPVLTDSWRISVAPKNVLKNIDKIAPDYDGEVDIYSLAEEDRKKVVSLTFSKRHLTHVDNQTGTFVFKDDKGYIATVVKKPYEVTFGASF